MFAVDENIHGQDAIHIDVIVHGGRPRAGPGIVQEPEADFRRCARSVLGRGKIRSPVAQFQVALRPVQIAPGAIAEQDVFRPGTW